MLGMLSRVTREEKSYGMIIAAPAANPRAQGRQSRRSGNSNPELTLWRWVAAAIDGGLISVKSTTVPFSPPTDTARRTSS